MNAKRAIHNRPRNLILSHTPTYPNPEQVNNPEKSDPNRASRKARQHKEGQPAFSAFSNPKATQPGHKQRLTKPSKPTNHPSLLSGLRASACNNPQPQTSK